MPAADSLSLSPHHSCDSIPQESTNTEVETTATVAKIAERYVTAGRGAEGYLAGEAPRRERSQGWRSDRSDE